ncbi:MAG TPA: hypothetical protein PLE54_08890 [Burkholderiaceae bacterium]|nr:hypothetical protein [Burkholderiaceae bacterium]HQR70706.1 hypothetical protein [Burkholderiaceae bacterium]
MRRSCIVLTLGLFCLPLGTMAQVVVKEASTSPAVSRFVMGTRLGYITCSDKYRAYLEKWELYSLVTEGQRDPQGTPPSDADVSDCVHQTALRGNALYKDALKGATTPKAKSAFGDYMVAWDAALKGIRKPERETVKQFRERQKKVEDQLNAQQQKLEAAVPGT